MRRFILAALLAFGCSVVIGQEQLALIPSLETILFGGNDRTRLTRILKSDGATVANYQPGNYTGTLAASAWANSIGVAPSLAQATGGNQPIIVSSDYVKKAYLPGVAGNDFTTPSAVANRITGDIDIRVDAAPASWTAGANQSNLVGKWEATPAYLLSLPALESKLQLSWVDSGGTTRTVKCDTNNGITDGTRAIVRATLTVATGAVSFYKSLDGGATWTQVGSTDSSIGATSIKDTAALVRAVLASPVGVVVSVKSRLFPSDTALGIVIVGVAP